MGTKTVRIPNQYSCSSTVPGKSGGDTDPQTAHHHGSGVGLQVALVGGHGIAHGRAQLGTEDGEGACPHDLPPYHHN